MTRDHERSGPSSGTSVPTPRRLRILLSSVPSDSHVWNLVVLQLLMAEMGHDVVNLGPCAPVDLLLDTCREQRPDCVVVSSVNGHGHVDGARIITALRADPGLADLAVVIGGKLGVHGDADPSGHEDLVDLGFDAVFPVRSGDGGDAVRAFQDFLARHFPEPRHFPETRHRRETRVRPTRHVESVP
jgi:methylmalonyl-CoA mutase cobalamin-binding subunit